MVSAHNHRPAVPTSVGAKEYAVCGNCCLPGCISKSSLCDLQGHQRMTGDDRAMFIHLRDYGPLTLGTILLDLDEMENVHDTISRLSEISAITYGKRGAYRISRHLTREGRD